MITCWVHIGLTEFEKINWLPMNNLFKQGISSTACRYFNELGPLYMKNVFKPARQNTAIARTSLTKLSQPLQKVSQKQKILSYVASSIWCKLPDSLKTTENKPKIIFIIMCWANSWERREVFLPKMPYYAKMGACPMKNSGMIYTFMWNLESLCIHNLA